MRELSVLLMFMVGVVCGCQSGDSSLPATTSDLTIEELSQTDSALGQYFSKQITVFGIPIVAAAEVADDKLFHAAHVMAAYLDNDQDGVVDSEVTISSMIENKALLVMFDTEDDIESSGLFEDDVIDSYWGQDLYAEETAPESGFDASLEEVLHLIQTAGYAQVWPDSLGFDPPTELTESMDLARGGHYESVPSAYPESAWYHYDDWTCDYECMAVEYFYWGLTSILGAQKDRCDDISVEWELCTGEAVAKGDPVLYELLTREEFALPTVLPTGVYTP